MSRGRVHPRALLQLVAVAAVMVAVAVSVWVVRATAPDTRLEPIAPAAPEPEQVVTCERTLPAAPESLEDISQVDPVGRVNSVDVIECPDAFDRQSVTYVGEVVGDVLHRRGGAWLLVNDDGYALRTGPLQSHDAFDGFNTGLSVWLPDPLPELEAGGPRQRGTVIEVRGVILRADPADGGGLTLRALDPGDVRVIREAEPIDRPINRGQAVLALVMAALAVGVVAIERRARARR